MTMFVGIQISARIKIVAKIKQKQFFEKKSKLFDWISRLFLKHIKAVLDNENPYFFISGSIPAKAWLILLMTLFEKKLGHKKKTFN